MQIVSTRFLRPRKPCAAAAFLPVAIVHMEGGEKGAAARRGAPAICIQSIIAYFDFSLKMQNCQLSLILQALVERASGTSGAVSSLLLKALSAILTGKMPVPLKPVPLAPATAGWKPVPLTLAKMRRSLLL